MAEGDGLQNRLGKPTRRFESYQCHKIWPKTFGIIKQKENKPKQKKFCPVCGKELKKSEYKYCSLECSHKSTKKLPEDGIIINHINNGLTNQEIGDMYGVTEACVRKWKKKHNA